MIHNTIQLNRYLALCGICARRKADAAIRSGDVAVNNKEIRHPGYNVSATDSVTYQGRAICPHQKVYYMLHKPTGVITTVEDTHDRTTVIDLMRPATPLRIFPVGRLDKNSSGLLLLTNDGDLAQRLLHPKFEKQKTYNVRLNRALPFADFRKIQDGITLEDGPVQVDSLRYTDETQQKLEITLHSGKNHIVRRIFAHVDCTVLKLHRTHFAGLSLNDLARGQWRELSKKEKKKLGITDE